ncbi:hypothetical protein [Neorhizobium tomejilense]|uniref:hypothetical protein n=1 Tax=Neorhizobium tomejilense TaxID=2093828 RepID=UPI001FE18ED7|nr:hypothetical protein [Neorhizobium tomejilense]
MLFYSMSLLPGARYRDGYKYVGRVGTGFRHDVAPSPKKQLDKLTKLSLVKAPGRSWS